MNLKIQLQSNGHLFVALVVVDRYYQRSVKPRTKQGRKSRIAVSSEAVYLRRIHLSAWESSTRKNCHSRQGVLWSHFFKWLNF